MRPIDYFDAAVAQFGDRLALDNPSYRATFEDLRRDSIRLAHHFMPVACFENQGRIGLLSPNDPRLIVCMLAVMRAGAVLAPIHSHHAVEGVTSAIRCLRPSLIVAHPSWEDCARRAVCEADVCCGVTTLDELPKAQSGELDDPDWGDVYGSQRHPVIMRQTSGSTGRPKTIVSDVASFVATHLVLHHVLRPSAHGHPVCLVVAPLSHAAGVHAFVMLSLGATLIIEGGFEPKAVLNAIETHQVTHLWLPASALYLLLRHLANTDRQFKLTSLRSVVLGASSVRTSALKEAVGRFGPCISVNYSQIESGFLTWLDEDTIARAAAGMAHHRLASSGKSLFASRIAIMDEDGRLLPTDTTGEIVVRGPGVKPYVATTYLPDDDELRLAHRYGWHHTGDLGHFDRDGYLYVDGRVRETINMAGLKISAQQIEQTLLECPDVVDCAVAAIPDAFRGEGVACVVVLREGCTIDRTELIARCASRIGRTFSLTRLEAWPVLPRTALGKIDKAAIRERLSGSG